MNKNNSTGNNLTEKVPIKHFLLIMRATLIFLFTCIFCSMADMVHTQNARVTINKRNATLREVLNEIESQTDYLFIYNNEVNTNENVSIKTKSTAVSEVLNSILKGKEIDYTMEGNHILLSRNENISSEEISALIAQQQKKQITGTVLDEAGVPVIGANIIEQGTTNGTITDIDGNFNLSVEENAVIHVSYIGYLEQDINTENQQVFNITLIEDTQALDELVVVGYGVQQKRDLTGSVGSIQFDENLTSRPIVDFGQALYGKIAGVNVLNSSGRPGSSSTIQIRGVNSISAGSAPLVVIDGIQLPGYDLNTINSNDIKSIEVLKDASSASIYGSRGANGVILVTTKSGTEGKPTLRFNYSYSIQKVIRKMNVMNSSEYAEAAIDAAQNGWIKVGGDPSAANTLDARGNYLYTWPEALENPNNLPNTDWQDLVFRTAPLHRVDLSFQGGNSNTQYLVSGGYINQSGIVITSEYQKFSLNLKINSKINNLINVGGTLNSTYDHEKEPFYRIVEWAIQYPTIYPVYGKNNYLGGPNSVDGFENYNAILFRPVNGHPLYNINQDIQHRRFTNMGSLFVNLSLNEYLNFRSSINAFYKRSDDTDYFPKDHGLGPSNYTTARFNSSSGRNINYIWENILTYEKKFNDHSINLLGGYEFNHRDYYWLQAERRDYDNDSFHYLSAGKVIFGANDNANETKLISLFGRINYNYRDKYLLTTSLRRDGSSRFGPNNKWGYFPSFALAWRILEEPFMNAFSNISNLKLRASFGFTGNDNFSDYRWISSMNQARVAMGNELVTSYYPSSIENPDLTWERTKQLNWGLDIGVFDQRINLEADFYNSISDNLLLSVPIPSISGFTNVFSNIGQIRNRGLEINMTSHNLISRLNWSTSLNFSLNRSKIMKLGPDNAPMIYGLDSFGTMQKINKVGAPLFSFYGYQYDGVYMNQSEIDNDPSAYSTATPGDGRYKDINGDNIINSEDRTIIGNYEPDFTWGITNSFSYKNLNLSFLFQGSVGGKLYNDDAHRSLLYHEGRNYLGKLRNRWRSEDNPGDGYHYKLSVTTDGFEKVASSYWLDDATYIRFKDITIGYDIPKKISSRIGANNTRIFLNGVNLLTISHAPVFDPENFVRHSGFSDPVNRGVGGSSYPSAKTISFGINVEF